MNKNLIWIFAILLLVSTIPNSYAVTRLFNDSFTRADVDPTTAFGWTKMQGNAWAIATNRLHISDGGAGNTMGYNNFSSYFVNQTRYQINFTLRTNFPFGTQGMEYAFFNTNWTNGDTNMGRTNAKFIIRNVQGKIKLLGGNQVVNLTLTDISDRVNNYSIIINTGTNKIESFRFNNVQKLASNFTMNTTKMPKALTFQRSPGATAFDTYVDAFSLFSLTATAVAPVITSITNRTTISGATINWTTDIASNTSINYGTTASLGTWSRTNDAVTAHSKTLTLLSPGTKYYFNVSSCAASLCSISSTNKLLTKSITTNLSYTAISPANGSVRNSNPVVFRVNITTNVTQVNCTYSQNTAPITSVLRNNPITFASFSRTLGNTSFNWTINCKNNVANGYQVNMTKREFFWNNVPPGITSTFTNGTIYLNKNITARFNISDDFSLFSYNISIDGVQKERRTNLNSTFYSINFSNYVTSLSAGIHTLKAVVYDGHTTNVIAPMETNTGLFGDYVKYTSKGKDIKIQNKESSFSDEFTTEKKTDRYIWTYEPATKTSSYTFVVTADETIYIKEAPKTYLKTWLIIGNKWVDFDVVDESETILIKRITKNQVEVTVGNIINPNKLTFNSIGELNMFEKQWYFYRATKTTQFITPVVESQTITSNLTVIRNNTATTSARFWYNKTEVTATKTSSASQDRYTISYTTPLSPIKNLVIPLYWNLTIGSEVNRTRLYQTTHQMLITNCTKTTTRKTIGFNMSDETTSSTITTNGSGLFKVWYADSSVYRNNMVQWTNKNSTYFCIYPNATLRTNYDILYSKGGYFPRHAIDLNTYLNLTLQDISLKLLSTGSGTAITIKLVNQFGGALAGYLMDLYKYESSSGNYTAVQSEISDVLGQSSFFNYASATKYRFLISNGTGVQVFDTGATGMYLIDNPTTLIVYLGQPQTFQTEYFNAWKLRTDLYNVSTNIILKWNTLTGTSGTICLNITRQYNNTLQRLSSACSNSPSGNMTYDFAGYTAGTINAVATIRGSSIVIDVLSIALVVTLRIFDYIGVDGLIIYILLITVCAAVTITNIKTMPYALMLAHGVSWYLGIIPGTFFGVVVIIAALMIVMWRIEE